MTSPVDHLAEPDVSPGEPVWVVEGGDGPDLARLVGVEPPADGGAGPPLGLVLLVHDHGAADNRLRAEEGQVGVVEDAAHVGLKGRRLNGFLGISLNNRTILFLVTLLIRTVSVG